MKFFLFVFCNIFSISVLANTMGELTATQGIANTVQGTAQVQPKNVVDKAEQAVQSYQDTQNKQLSEISAENPAEEKSIIHSSETVPTSKEALDERLEDGEILQNTPSVDYKRQVQIFYKRECEPLQESCSRGAVLTNIKSLIFDYAHNRGSFSKAEQK